MPSDVAEGLRSYLENHKYRYCATMRDTGVYEVLLRLDSGEFLGRPGYLLPFTEESVNRLGDINGSWRLTCCCDTHQLNARLWVACMTDMEGRFIFGDKELPHQLLAEVRAAGGLDRQI